MQQLYALDAPTWLKSVLDEVPANEGAADRAAWAELRTLKRSSRPSEPQVSLFIQTHVLQKVCRYGASRLTPQGSASRGVIDYSVSCEGSRHIWIEVKRTGTSLKPEMIRKYLDGDDARHHKAVLGVLTSGDEWEFWCGGLGIKLLEVEPFPFARLWISKPQDFARLRLVFGSSQVFRRYLQGVLSHVPARNALLKRERVRTAFEDGYKERFHGPVPTLSRVLSPSGERIDPRIIAGRLALFSACTEALYRELRDSFGCKLRRTDIINAQGDWPIDPLG